MKKILFLLFGVLLMLATNISPPTAQVVYVDDEFQIVADQQMPAMQINDFVLTQDYAVWSGGTMSIGELLTVSSTNCPEIAVMSIMTDDDLYYSNKAYLTHDGMCYEPDYTARAGSLAWPTGLKS